MRKLLVILMVSVVLISGCRPPLVGRCPVTNVACYDDGMTP